MTVSVLVPKLANDSSGGIIAEWYEKDGATVVEGQLLFRLERDFIAFDVEAEHGGILRHRATAGEFFFAGAIVAAIVEADEFDQSGGEEIDLATQEKRGFAVPSVAEVSAEGAEEHSSEPLPFPAVHKGQAVASNAPESWLHAEPDERAAHEAPPTDQVDDFETGSGDTNMTDTAAKGTDHGTPKPVEIHVPASLDDGRSMWDDAVAATTESESGFMWSDFDSSIEDYESFAPFGVAEDQDHPLAALDDAPVDEAIKQGRDVDADDEGQSNSVFDTAAEEDDVDWDVSADDEGQPSPVFDAVSEKDNPAWEVSGEVEQPDAPPEAIFDESTDEEKKARSDPTFSEDWVEEDDPADGMDPGGEQQEHSPAKTDEGTEASDESRPDENELSSEAEVDSEREAPEGTSFDESDSVHQTFNQEANEVAQVAAQAPMHMAIDVQVAAAYAEGKDSFAMAIATAVELVVGETWEDYGPAVTLVDSDASFGPPEGIAVLNFAALGIDRADAPLSGDAPVAFAVGALREHVSFNGQAIGIAHRANVSMTYDSTRLDEFEAASILAGVRNVIEASGDTIAA